MSEETGWLIEQKEGNHLWWAADRWTSESTEAVRFCRKEDAEQVIRAERMRNFAFTTEHAWMPTGPLTTAHVVRMNRDEAGRSGYDRALRDIGYTVSVGMIAAERRRQVEGESWTSCHDDGHVNGELALAAACYAIESAGRSSVEYRLGHAGGLEVNVDTAGLYWPWGKEWWKPGTAIRNLVKAGALIAAEIDRRLRAGEEVKP